MGPSPVLPGRKRARPPPSSAVQVASSDVLLPLEIPAAGRAVMSALAMRLRRRWGLDRLSVVARLVVMWSQSSHRRKAKELVEQDTSGFYGS